ncbi:hypothetical protein H2O64_13945 [Kordia sp. YSTF-M3]|uniref:DUF3278 domain-containing protein n=1 Tax=Kordia aestuariivivens TaxID=2759037 RepID=A0ABR7QB24_9FLAO|nr:hypothetical protein [Kordia aestuariivivens]MBC8755774.1 hypothetical protein [Kordia aestuariivivens]
MNNSTIKAFFNEIILDKFMVNFVPGLILFFVLTTFIRIPMGEGLTIFLIVTSISWVLGILLEMTFFRKTYLTRRENTAFTTSQSLNLLFGKIGISIIIACVLWIDIEAVIEYRGNTAEAIFLIIRFLVFTLAGLFLYLYYLKSRIKE